MAQVQGAKRASLFPCCPGKCAYGPGGGPRRKDPGSGVLPGGAQGEAECHGGDAAAGISQLHVLLSCLPSVLTNCGESSALQGVVALDVS